MLLERAIVESVPRPRFEVAACTDVDSARCGLLDPHGRSLSGGYPSNIWKKFEPEQFKQRFVSGSAIPIRLSDAPLGMLDETRKCAGITFDVAGDMEAEVNEMARTFIPKLAKDRQVEPNTESG